MTAYQLVKSDDDGTLKNVVTTAPTDIVLLPGNTATPTKEACSLESSEEVLAELLKFIQHGVEMLEVRDQHDDDGPFDMNALLCDSVERMAKINHLLKEEGVVQDDILNMARELLNQCHDIVKGCVLEDAASLKGIVSKVSALLNQVRPVDLDLCLQLLLAAKEAGDTMQDKDVLLLLGQTG